MTDFSIVIPTVGRDSLQRLLAALRDSSGPRPAQIVVVDDRIAPVAPAVERVGGWVDDVLAVRYSTGTGPAAARNIGWRACETAWVAFLDDDVLVGPTWLRDLASDLAEAADDVAGSQARIHVPLPTGRRPTDWERGTAGLATAKWITADMAYRRAALLQVGGFDERFPRAFREDADLALRALRAGWRLAVGRRTTTHPVRSAPWNASLKQQRGNADDALMSRLHGKDWYDRAAAPRGRRPRHLAVTAALGIAAVAGALRQWRVAGAALGPWAAGMAEFAAARIVPGPRDSTEVGRMIATSVLIPPLATVHWVRGVLAHRQAQPLPPAEPLDVPAVDAVLLDRDGTLIHDVAYNGDPGLVRPIAGARAALDRLRAGGLKLGVISNQSGVARGLISEAEVRAVNDRIEELLGPFDTWQYCPHDDRAGCECRKPRPGMVLKAAADLGVPVENVVEVGDIGADIQAGRAAGAGASVLVPNEMTRLDELRAAPHRFPDLAAAADAILAASSAGGER
jgi:histidinol-phosphate phosphatase family protein